MATLQDYLGITALRDAWPKWKANVVAVNNQVINHVAGSADKHAAQDITYTGDFVGKTEVKAAIDQAKTEIDTIVVNASVDPEVALARDSTVKGETFDTLDARLEEDEQDLDNIKKLKNWELQNKSRKQQAIFSFVDDDGNNDVIEKLLPVATLYNFKFTTAIVGKSVIDGGSASSMKKADILYLQSLGHEIASHTYNHAGLTDWGTASEADIKQDFEDMDTLLKSWGLDVKTLVYPGGYRNDIVIDIAREYFRGARIMNYGVNTTPLETWDIPVINGEGTLDDSDTLTTAEKIVLYKARIDTMIATNSWGIYVSHIYADPITIDHVAIIAELAQYLQSQGVEIVTFNEGFNRMGNIIDNGRYWKLDSTKPHYVLGANNKVESDTQSSTIKTPSNYILATTPPQDIIRGKKYITQISFSNSAGFPENNSGKLVTDAINIVRRQIYCMDLSNNIYTRYDVDVNDSEWSTWKTMTPTLSLATLSASTLGITATSLLSDFTPLQITYTQISYSNRIGFPTSTGGTLMTNRILENDAYAYQIYHCVTSSDTHKRYWDSTDWSVWSKITMV